MTFYWRKSTVWPWERIFSQKVPENHLFWRQDFWITWLWRGLAPTILKIETFSACVSENLGHELSDEPWADLLASKLSDWQPFEIFLGAAMENCKKRRFLLKPLLLDIFVRQNFFTDRTMWKLSSRGFRKCGTFCACDLSKGSYCCSKSAEGGKSGCVPANRQCKKKRHGHNFDFFGLKRIARLLNYVEQPCYSFRTKKIKIVAVSFFCNAAFPSIFFLIFDPTSTANNSTLKTARPKKYHIFGILGT